MKYKIAICDDNSIDRDYLSSVVTEWAAGREHTVQAETFPSAEAFLFHYANEKDYDILLLDIEMKDMNGIELAKRIRLNNAWVQIVFITGYPDFISEGYEVSALHYLMKPAKKEKLFQVLDKAAGLLQKKERNILLQMGSESIRIPADAIIYVEAFSHYLTIHTTYLAYEVKISMSQMEELLGDGFVRCHRSYIAGIKHIARISKTEIIFDSNQAIPLARNSYNAVNLAFIGYYKGNTT